jgi:hypothetical protein
LTNPDNRFNKRVTNDASVFTVTGNTFAAALDATARISSSTVREGIQSLNTFDTAAPAPLVILSAAPGVANGSGSTAPAGGGVNSEGVNIQLMDGEATNTFLMAAVSLPKGTATSGVGFSFDLPESVRSVLPENASPRATQSNGESLPSWLRFKVEDLRFEAAAVPDGAFPMEVALQIGQLRILVVISERTE